MHSTTDDDSNSSRADGPSLPGNQQGSGRERLLRKLLVVDDEVDGAELAATLLRAHGFEVLVAHAAKDALQLLEKDKDIDAILSDVVMPGMSGMQLAEAVRVMYPTVKVILMSGYIPSAQFKDHDRPYLFASKPFRMETILKLLRT